MNKPVLSAGIALVFLFMGMSFMEIEVFTRAEGEITPAIKAIKISSNMPGVIDKIYVNSGQVVNPGDALARLDGREINIKINNIMSELKYARDKLAILTALLEGNEHENSNSILFDLHIKHRNYINDLEILMQHYELEKEIIDKLVDLKTLPKLKAIVVNQKLLKDKKEINKSTKDFWERVVFDAEQQKATILRLESALAIEKFKLDNTEIVSPKHGVINKIYLSEHEFIHVGDDLLELAPDHKNLKAKILIHPDDIGGIKLGQKVKLQIETFNYKIFGTSDAYISYLSPDAVEETITGNKYIAECTLKNDYMQRDGKKFQLKPGMKVFASVMRGKVSAAQYLVAPLIRSFYLIGVL